MNNKYTKKYTTSDSIFIVECQVKNTVTNEDGSTTEVWSKVTTDSNLTINRNNKRIHITFDKTKLDFRKSSIKNAKIYLKCSSQDVNLSSYFKDSIYTIEDDTLIIDVISLIKSDKPFDLILSTTRTIEFYSETNIPYIELTIIDGKKTPLTKTLSVTNTVDCIFNMEHNKSGISVKCVDGNTSIAGIPINLLKNKKDKKLELSLNETFKEGVYTNAYGDSYGIEEQFFRIENKKKIPVYKDTVTVHADGSFSTAIEDKVYEVFREELLPGGQKASTTVKEVENFKHLETRSDEIKQYEDQNNNYFQFADSLSPYIYNSIDNTITCQKNQKRSLEDFPELESYLADDEGLSLWDEKLLLTDTDYISFKQLMNEKNSFTFKNEDNSKKYFNNHSYNLLSYYDTLRLRDEIYKMGVDINAQIANFIFIDNDGERFYPENIRTDSEYLNLVNLNTYNSIRENAVYDWVNNTGDSKTDKFLTGKDFLNYIETRNLYIIDLENIGNQLKLKSEKIEDQINFFKKQSKDYLDQLAFAYKEHFNLKEKLKELKQNTPVSFISTESMHKGYNEYGWLVGFFDNYQNYISVNRDKDGKIISLSDDKNNAVLFKYDHEDNLEYITDVRGRTVTLGKDDNGNFTVTYPDGHITTIVEDLVGTPYKIISSNGITATLSYTTDDLLSGIVRTSSVGATIDSVSISYTDNGVEITNYDKTTTRYVISDDKITETYTLVGNTTTSAQKIDEIYDDTNQTTTRTITKASKSSLYEDISAVSFTGDTTVEVIDGFDRITSKTTTTDTKTVATTYDYDEFGLLVKETSVITITGVTTPYTAITEYSYDVYKNLIKTVSYVVGEVVKNGKSVEEWVYDNKGNLLKSFTYNTLDTSSKFYTEHIYDENGNHLANLDETGEHKTQFEYVDKSGLVKTEKLPNGSKFSYGYDLADNLTAITQSTEDGEENSVSKIYENGLLKEYKSGNNTVIYTYDDKRRVTAINVNGEQNYLTYAYEEDVTYTDGDIEVICDKVTVTDKKNVVHIIYTDKLGRVWGDFKNDTDYWFKYVYNKSLLSEKYDTGINNTRYKYTYDSLNRLTKLDQVYVDEEYSYDSYGNITQKTLKRPNVATHTYRYSYSTDSRQNLQSITIDDTIIKPQIDCNGRSTGKEVYFVDTANAISEENKICEEQITYLKKGDHATNLPSTIRYGGTVNSEFVLTDNLKYIYDNMGNVSEIRENGNLIAKYSYDSINRLIREDNKKFGKSYFFSYDNNGNILRREETSFTLKPKDEITSDFTTFNYYYDGDKLISYNGEICEYDNLGQPTKYRNNIVTFSDIGAITSYKDKKFTNLNSKLRYCCTGAGLVYEYYTESGDLMLRRGIDEFIYDNTGVCGIIRKETSTIDETTQIVKYFYRKNAQGDIIALLDNTGEVVVRYVYDAWGNHKIYLADGTEIYDNHTGIVEGYEDHIGNVNPFRYRSYIFDSEINLYYLKSRYYDPETGRFISPDSVDYLDPDSINGLNLYAYCGNDPINKYDPSGHFAITLTTLLIGGLIAGAIGAGIGLGTAIYKDVKEDGIWFNGDWTDYVGRTLGGFVAGFGVGICTVLGAGVGAAALGGTTATLFTSTGLTLSLGSALGIGSGVAFATGMAGYAVRTGISRSEDFKVQNMFIEGGFNAVSGALSVLGGYLGGMAGVHNTVFTKLLSQKGDFWLRLLVENVFTAGFKLTNALIKPYFMI